MKKIDILKTYDVFQESNSLDVLDLSKKYLDCQIPLKINTVSELINLSKVQPLILRLKDRDSAPFVVKNECVLLGVVNNSYKGLKAWQNFPNPNISNNSPEFLQKLISTTDIDMVDNNVEWFLWDNFVISALYHEQNYLVNLLNKVIPTEILEIESELKNEALAGLNSVLKNVDLLFKSFFRVYSKEGTFENFENYFEEKYSKFPKTIVNIAKEVNKIDVENPDTILNFFKNLKKMSAVFKTDFTIT